MKTRKVNIAIIGLGNIGSYFYNYLKKNKNFLKKKTNTSANIIYVSARNFKKKRSIKFPKSIWLKNPLSATKNKKVDVIIELIGGSEGIAKKIVFDALRNKKHVVTANKALVSKYGDQLARIAELNNVNFEFEAAVCGGIPIVRSIKEGLIANKINKIYGILNGTSNYILSSMDRDKISFKESLIKAQKLGYAETNPSSDINGEDVSSKLKILSSLCFNSFINNNIFVEGITKVDQTDIFNANKLGYKIKLLGVAEFLNGKLIQRVHPSFVKKSSYIASINGVLNAVLTNGSPMGQSIIQGEGAGPKATTSALISDLSSILRGNIKYPFAISNKERKNVKFDTIKNQNFSCYVRLDVLDKHGILSNITSILSKNKVSIKRLIQNPFKSKKFSSIILITHKANESNLIKSMKQLSKKKYLFTKPKLIRIEN